MFYIIFYPDHFTSLTSLLSNIALGSLQKHDFNAKIMFHHGDVLKCNHSLAGGIFCLILFLRHRSYRGPSLAMHLCLRSGGAGQGFGWLQTRDHWWKVPECSLALHKCSYYYVCYYYFLKSNSWKWHSGSEGTHLPNHFPPGLCGHAFWAGHTLATPRPELFHINT